VYNPYTSRYASVASIESARTGRRIGRASTAFENRGVSH
jgi:hypothetical protein